MRMIVTDGVFSMDGHIAPLQEICTLGFFFFLNPFTFPLLFPFLPHFLPLFSSFSTHIPFSPLPTADKYNALVMIDDCHATGFLGENGKGTAELCGVEDRIDVLNTTLGKAMGGGTGGYTSEFFFEFFFFFFPLIFLPFLLYFSLTFKIIQPEGRKSLTFFAKNLVLTSSATPLPLPSSVLL